MKNMVIGLVNAKGGVGKTTSTIHLATRFAQQGHSVEVWDADPQGTASEWAQRAEERSDELPFSVEPVNLPSIRKKKAQAQFTFIDSPPQNESILNAIAERADLVVVPTAPTGADVERVLSTISSMPQGKPTIALLTDANPRYVLYKETLEVLDQAGLAYFDQPIKTREVIKAAYGRTPTQFSGYEDVAEELLEHVESLNS